MAADTREGWKPPCGAGVAMRSRAPAPAIALGTRGIAALLCATAPIVVLLGTWSNCRFGQLYSFKETGLRAQANVGLSLDLQQALAQKANAPVAQQLAQADPQESTAAAEASVTVYVQPKLPSSTTSVLTIPPTAIAPPAMMGLQEQATVPEAHATLSEAPAQRTTTRAPSRPKHKHRSTPPQVHTTSTKAPAQSTSTSALALTSTRAPSRRKHKHRSTPAQAHTTSTKATTQSTSTSAPAPLTSTRAPSPKHGRRSKPTPQPAHDFGAWRAGQNQTWAKTCKPYPGKRVVLVQANAQYLDMFRNWLFHASQFWNPHTDQLVIAAESKSTVNVMKELSGLFGVHWDVQFLGSSGEDAAATSKYGGGVWSKVVTHRPTQILQMLEQGCSVLYSDIDIVWIRPVFAVLDSAGQFDAYIANDAERIRRFDLCTCTMYFHPTAANKELMDRWAKALIGKSKNQGAFNGVVMQMNRAHSISYHKLSQSTFPNGRQAQASKATAAALHANYMRGIGTKANFLQKLGYWNPAGSISKRAGGR